MHEPAGVKGQRFPSKFFGFSLLDVSKIGFYKNGFFKIWFFKIGFFFSNLDFSKLNLSKLNCSKLHSSFFKLFFLFFLGRKQKRSAARVPPRPEAPKKGSYIFGTPQFEFDVRRYTFKLAFGLYSDYTMDPKTSA